MGSTITAETIIDGNTTTKIEYFYDSYGPYGFSLGTTFYYYVKNLQGDVTQIRDTSNNLIASYSYDAWGRVLSVTENTTNNIGAKNAIRYRGYYYDTESNLYYLNARYYDPQIKRFISPDTTLGANSGINAYNLYAYCGNNPVIYVDYTGEFPVLIILAAVVAVCCVSLSSCHNDDPLPIPEFNPYSEPYDSEIEAVKGAAAELLIIMSSSHYEHAATIYFYNDSYYYGKPYNTGSNISLDETDYELYSRKKGLIIVADIHTHPECNGEDVFSIGDVEFVNKAYQKYNNPPYLNISKKFKIYLLTSSGVIKQYNKGDTNRAGKEVYNPNKTSYKVFQYHQLIPRMYIINY